MTAPKIDAARLDAMGLATAELTSKLLQTARDAVGAKEDLESFSVAGTALCMAYATICAGLGLDLSSAVLALEKTWPAALNVIAERTP